MYQIKPASKIPDGPYEVYFIKLRFISDLRLVQQDVLIESVFTELIYIPNSNQPDCLSFSSGQMSRRQVSLKNVTRGKLAMLRFFSDPLVSKYFDNSFASCKQ